MTQTPHNAPPEPAGGAAAEPVVPGALLDDDVLEDLRLAEMAERQRLERRIARNDVTAILVSHNGARWLPYVLTALADLTHPPHRVVAVDTGSTDSTRRLLSDSLTEAGVLDHPSGTTFGAAVAGAVDAYGGAPGLPTPDVEAPRVDWIWLLHDDSAPESDALRHLLLAAERNPRAAVIGPKVRGWRDGRLLLELGISVGRGGRRETWLERDETDQGQHDHRREVLAVGSAGMLIKRDVWEQLGGFDPAFVMFREDVDLCWRAWRAGHDVVVAPDAVVHHVEAAAHGRRRSDPAIAARPHRADRTSALMLLLANLPARALPWSYLRLLVGSVLRAAGLALAKAPGEALDELVAMLAVLARPDRVLSARGRRRGGGVRPWAEIKPLLAHTGSHLRQGLEALFGLMSLGTAVRSVGGSALESGPSDSDDSDMASMGPGVVRRAFSRPGTWLALGLLTLALIADRRLFGGGSLQGGALLPAPARASDLWARYVQAWHDVGVGSSVTAPPSLAVLAFPSWLAFGHAGVVMSVLLLLAVPLAGCAAYVLTGHLTQRRWVRVWAAATYALLPPITGAVAAGRIGTATLSWLLPVIVLVVLRAVRRDSRWPVTWFAVLLLAAGAALVPLLWVASAALAVAVLVVGVLRRGISSLWRGRGATARLLVLVLAPPLLLLPWSATLATHPRRLFLEAGAPARSTVEPQLPAWALDLVQPGGPTAGSRWLFVGLVVVALAALLRADRRRPVVLAWGVALVGLGLAVAALVLRVPGADAGGDAVPWPGAATLFLGGGLVAAATVGGDGLRDRLAARTFGWRQPLTLLLAAVAVAGTVAAAVSWTARGADEPLARVDTPLLPPYVSATTSGPLQPRTLLLGAGPGGRVAYSLERGSGPLMGDSELAPPPSASGNLDDIVSGLAAGVENGAAVQRLGTYGVSTIVALRPVPPTLMGALDSTPGLQRLASTTQSAVWRVADTPGRLRLIGPGHTTLPLTSPTPEKITAEIPNGPEGRRVVMADATDPRWQATLDGVALRPTDAGWAQGFTLPAGGGQLVISYDRSTRRHWLLIEGILLLGAIVLALPARRRREEPDDDLPPEPLHPVEVSA